ncbi:MAG: VWA domain-containing protein [Flavobacteriaceae bacterium]|nr:VWA domain-containing protein [Flavobacteriaceae bacterium]
MIGALKNINWAEFHFLRPQLLWILVPIALLFLVNLFASREQIKWQKVIAPHLRQYVIKKGSESLKKWMQLLSFITLSLAIIGVSGPTWNKVELPEKKLETPLVIALDLSQSMMATDIQPNRLERAKFKITDLLDANPRARIALVGFSGTAHTVIPLTRDYKIIKSHISGLSPNIMPYEGTNLKAALEIADTLTNHIDAPATLLLITDDFTEHSFNLLQSYIQNNNTSVTIIPMATNTGAKIPKKYGRGLIQNKKGKLVHSSLDQSVLSKLASVEKITINELTLDNSDMELLAKSIAADLEFTEKDNQQNDDWEDKGIWFIIPLAFLLVLSFRKGWVIYSLLILVTFSSCSKVETFDDLWFTKNYQAQKLSNKGNFEKAAETYTDPLRKGIAYYKSGNYDEAISEFSRDTTAMGAYNLGISYYKSGDYASAEIAFGKAIELDPDMDAAKKNQQLATQNLGGESEVSKEEAEEARANPEEQRAENEQNKSPEDLSGGGQKATEEDMKKERLEETTNTDIRKGKELEEVPDDFESGKQDGAQKVLMRKVDDDPALFLKRKFKHQVKINKIKPPSNIDKW